MYSPVGDTEIASPNRPFLANGDIIVCTKFVAVPENIATRPVPVRYPGALIAITSALSDPAIA